MLIQSYNYVLCFSLPASCRDVQKSCTQNQTYLQTLLSTGITIMMYGGMMKQRCLTALSLVIYIISFSAYNWQEQA